MNFELLAIILYFAAMITIGVVVMLRNKENTGKAYFLGNRTLGPFTAGLSAQASDMSSWLLMGLPGAIVIAGFQDIWISIGLALGSYLAWLFIAGRLRVFSAAAGDSITIPEFLRNRFLSKGKALQVVCAIVFTICFTIYVASGYTAIGRLFSFLFNIDVKAGMLIFGVIVMFYTLLGGFKAVCFTDLLQSLIILGAFLIVPILLLVTVDFSSGAAAIVQADPEYFSFFAGSGWASASRIISGLAWGLGYFGMPHIIIRYMSIKSAKQVRTARVTATSWSVITLAAASLIGILGRIALPDLTASSEAAEFVFIRLAREVVFSNMPFLSGLVLSAILAASMSTADSQLLVASSSISNDLYKPLCKTPPAQKTVVRLGQVCVAAIMVIAYFIATSSYAVSVMSVVSDAWAGFGGAFGPVIVLSLYWRRMTYNGAIAGIICGGASVYLWIVFLSGVTGIYALLPGFIVGIIASVVVSLLDKKPGKEVGELFDAAIANL